MKRGRFRQMDNRAVAAVEFALMMPLLLLLFIGTVEISLLYRTEAKLDEFAGSFAEMVSLQDPSLSSGTVLSGGAGEFGELCTGAIYGLQPFPANGLTVAVASLTKISTSPVRYDYWEADASCPASASPIGRSTVCALAVNGAAGNMLANLDDNVLIVRGTLGYPGLVGMFLGTAPRLTQTVFSRWRYASTLQSPAELLCTGTDCTIAKTITC